MVESSVANRPAGVPVREAVGLFKSPDELESAVAELEKAGFSRAHMSVLGSAKKRRESISDLYHSAAELAERGLLTRAQLGVSGTEDEEESEASKIPIYIGGIAGMAAVAASGGALALAVAGLFAGGLAGAGVGAILKRVIHHSHAEAVEEQITQGGLLLWVDVASDGEASQALGILNAARGQNVHLHEVSSL